MLKEEVFDSNTVLGIVYAPTIHYFLGYLARTGYRYFLWNGVVYEACDDYMSYRHTGLNVKDLK